MSLILRMILLIVCCMCWLAIVCGVGINVRPRSRMESWSAVIVVCERL